jgi:hypothetical protein
LCLNVDFHVPFKDLLHAANLRHGNNGFTSPLKESMLRIFFRPEKSLTVSAGFKTRELRYLKAARYPLTTEAARARLKLRSHLRGSHIQWRRLPDVRQCDILLSSYRQAMRSAKDSHGSHSSHQVRGRCLYRKPSIFI